MSIKIPVINTKEELLAYILSEPSIYEALPEKVKTNLDDGIKTIIQFIDLALRAGKISVDEVHQIISWDSCTEEVLHAWCDMWNIPLPRFPSESHARVHAQSEYTLIAPPDWGSSYVQPCYVESGYVEPQIQCTPFIFDYAYQFDHYLGTYDYIFQVVLWDGSNNSFAVQNADDYFDAVLVEPNKLTLYRDNPLEADGLYIEKVMFIYHKDYLNAKRLIARNALVLDGMRYTAVGLEYYLELLLSNYGVISVESSSSITTLFQCLRFDSVSNNLGNCRIFIMDGSNLSEVNPLIFPGYNFEGTTITITIASDLQKDIVEFIRNATINYFIPFKKVIGPNVKFTFNDTSIDWISNAIWPVS